MSTFNLNEVTRKILSLISESDEQIRVSNKHQHTAFSIIIKHFEEQNYADITIKMLDEFILTQWEQLENTEITPWKWRLVRRGSELIKYFLKTDSVKMQNIEHWVPQNKQPYQRIGKYIPSPEQLNDHDNIFSLVYKVKQVASEMGLSSSVDSGCYFAHGLHVIMKKHSILGLEIYSEALVCEMINTTLENYKSGTVSRTYYQNMRKAGNFLSEMYKTGAITLCKLPNHKNKNLSSEFNIVIESFYENEKRLGRFAESTINTAKSSSRILCFELESQNIYSFDTLDLPTTTEIITQTSKRYAGGLPCFMFCIKVFLTHLYENKVINLDLSIAIPDVVATRKIFREGFSVDEINCLLEMPELESSIGKRDYAIMLMAANTGLRICDIANLKRNDIDWRTKEIRIVQNKTGKPLSLPLNPSVGNAIAEYLLNGRPKSDLPNIFLCQNGGLPKTIKNRGASAIVSRYLKRSSIKSDIARRGAHSFRRGFGTRLLQNETPLELLQQLLGHTDVNSSKPYLSVDEEGLKKCSLSLVSCKKVGETI